MRVIVDNQEIYIPEEIKEEISLVYENPENYKYIVDYGISILIVYDEECLGTKKWMKGYMYYPSFESGSFSRMPKDKDELSLQEKADIVEKYLGIRPHKEKEIENLFRGIRWLERELNSIEKM